MTLRFLLLAALALAAGTAAAQEGPRIVPLTRDPGRAAHPSAAALRHAAQRPTAITLPFFQDFSNAGSTAPDPFYWVESGVYQNNRFAVAPPTQGVVTLDGFNAFGEPYAGLSSSAASDLDTLTSKGIDLSGSSNDTLSFWWQRGGVGDNILAPGVRARLVLEFSEDGNFWTPSGWEQSGTGTNSTFAQAKVPIPAQFLTAEFQFRFRFRGTYNDIVHCWNLDYIEIDPGRPIGSVRDIAMVQPLPPALRRYSAMPFWQYNVAAAAGSEIADSTRTTLSNLQTRQALQTPVNIEGKLNVALVDGTPITANTFLTDSRVIGVGARDVPVAGPLRAALPAQPVPLSDDAKTLTQEVRVISGDPDPSRQVNDVIVRTDTLADYYAYDDGSAEAGFTLNAQYTGSAAYAFDTDMADQVAGVSLYLPGDLPAGQLLFVEIWPDDPQQPGQPATTSLFRASFRVPADSILRRLHRWYHIWFAPQPVSGRFYVGYSQPANAGIVNIGFDLNDTARAARRLYYRINSGNWGIFSTTPGSLLVRPRMNNNGAVGLPEDAAVLEPGIYPNPVSAALGEVRLTGQFTEATLLDALGRTVRKAAATTDYIDVRGLPSGVYVLRFRTPQGGTTRRLVVTQ